MNVMHLSPKPVEETGFSKPRTTLEILPLGGIEADAQVRLNFEEEPLSTLIESLKKRGQILPILAYFDAERGKHIIIDGERRFRAAREAGIKTLEAVVFPFRPEQNEIDLVQLTIDSQREDLNPLERAKSFSRVMKANGWSANELAAHIDVAHTTVTRAVDLLDLSAEFHEMITKGTLPTNIARELARLPEEQRIPIWKQIQDSGLNANGAQKLITKLLKPKAKSGRPKPKNKHVYKNLSGFEATVTPKKITLIPSATAKPKTREQMIAAIEMLLAKMREDTANDAAQAPNGSPVAAAAP